MSMIGGVAGTVGGYRSVGEPGVRETAMDMGSPVSVIGGVEGRRENWMSIVEGSRGSGTWETSMGKGEEGRTVSEAAVCAGHSSEAWSVSLQREQGGGEALRFPLSFFLFFRR